MTTFCIAFYESYLSTLSSELGVLATGSNDMRIRLWNPIVTARYNSTNAVINADKSLKLKIMNDELRNYNVKKG
jgi:hypothetical protein